MAAAAAIASIVGTGLSVIGKIQEGKAKQASLNFQAQENEKKAAEERAAGQREAFEKRDETARVMSRQRALAASSGAGVVNPTVLDIYGDTAQEGEYNAQAALYGGESRARGQIDQANAARAKGKAVRTGSLLEAGGSLFSGLSKTDFSAFG